MMPKGKIRGSFLKDLAKKQGCRIDGVVGDRVSGVVVRHMKGRVVARCDTESQVSAAMATRNVNLEVIA
jgi:hypothetical protein